MSEVKVRAEVLRDVVGISVDLHSADGADPWLSLVSFFDMSKECLPVKVPF
jgi:hypothetical protein